MTCPAVTWVDDWEVSDDTDPAMDDHAEAAKENSSEAVPVATCWDKFSVPVQYQLQPDKIISPVFTGVFCCTLKVSQK